MILSLLLLAAAPLWAQTFNAPPTWANLTEQSPARLRVSIARQPSSVFRAVIGERLPEAAALYTVRVCGIASISVEVDPGAIEQAVVERGVSITPRALAQHTFTRSRSRGMSALVRFGEMAMIAAPVVVGFAASGNLSLKPWQITTISGLGTGLRLLGDSTQSDRDKARASIGDLGAWPIAALCAWAHDWGLLSRMVRQARQTRAVRPLERWTIRVLSGL